MSAVFSTFRRVSRLEKVIGTKTLVKRVEDKHTHTHTSPTPTPKNKTSVRSIDKTIEEDYYSNARSTAPLSRRREYNRDSNVSVSASCVDCGISAAST